MKPIPRMIGLIASFIGVAYLIAAAVFVFSENARDSAGNIANQIVNLGCRFDTYALPLLVAIFVLLGIEAALTFREATPAEAGETWKQKWQRFSAASEDASVPLATLSACTRLLLVFFFISQLSYLSGVCR